MIATLLFGPRRSPDPGRPRDASFVRSRILTRKTLEAFNADVVASDEASPPYFSFAGGYEPLPASEFSALADLPAAQMEHVLLGAIGWWIPIGSQDPAGMLFGNEECEGRAVRALAVIERNSRARIDKRRLLPLLESLVGILVVVLCAVLIATDVLSTGAWVALAISSVWTLGTFVSQIRSAVRAPLVSLPNILKL